MHSRYGILLLLAIMHCFVDVASAVYATKSLLFTMMSIHFSLVILLVITTFVATAAFQPTSNNPSLKKMIRPSYRKLHPSNDDDIEVPITVSTIDNNDDKLSIRYVSCLAVASIITIPMVARAAEGVGDKMGEIGGEWFTSMPSSAPVNFVSWLNGISNLLLHSTFFWIYVAISIYRIVKKEYIDKDS